MHACGAVGPEALQQLVLQSLALLGAPLPPWQSSNSAAAASEDAAREEAAGSLAQVLVQQSSRPGEPLCSCVSCSPGEPLFPDVSSRPGEPCFNSAVVLLRNKMMLCWDVSSHMLEVK